MRPTPILLLSVLLLAGIAGAYQTTDIRVNKVRTADMSGDGNMTFNVTQAGVFLVNNSGYCRGNWDSTNRGCITNATLTAWRNWTFPNADGTVTLTSGGLTTGGVLYSSSGQIAEDPTEFYYDATNDRLSVGSQTTTINVQGADIPVKLTTHVDSTETGFNFAAHKHSSTANDPAEIGYVRSRGTGASPTILSVGDQISRVSGYGYDGNSYEHAAGIRFDLDATPGNNDMAGRIVFLVSPDGSVTPTEVYRITHAGWNYWPGPLNTNGTIGTSGFLYANGGALVNNSITSTANVIARTGATSQTVIGDVGPTSKGALCINGDTCFYRDSAGLMKSGTTLELDGNLIADALNTYLANTNANGTLTSTGMLTVSAGGASIATGGGTILTLTRTGVGGFTLTADNVVGTADGRWEPTTTNSGWCFYYKTSGGVTTRGVCLAPDGRLEIEGSLDHDGTTAGFFGTTPQTQCSAIADPTGGAIIDSQARTAVTAVITALERFGLCATV